MLIEFRVSNFRSIKDEQVLSLVASSDKSLMETNVSNTGLSSVPNILRSAAIYGANASGKSNLIMALGFMRGAVMHSATKPEGKKVYLKPFLLDRKSASSPSNFEVTFLIDKIRYQYGFSITEDQIVAEHLLVYKKPKPQRWFTRYYDEINKDDVYKFNSGLKGPKTVWQEATRNDSLYLSVATQLNSKELKPIFDWFHNNLIIFPDPELLSERFSAELIANDEKKETMLKYITSADINIKDIEVIQEKVSEHGIEIDNDTGKPELIEKKIDTSSVYFHHPSDTGTVPFKFEDESEGTKVLFSLIGPSLDILENGYTLIIDELHKSLHPLLLIEIVKLFHGSKYKSSGAQLIFSTHDTTLLSTFGLFRRDQIYIIDKGNDQASVLYSISDFSLRKTDNIEKAYLSGQVGGTPLIDHDMLDELNGLNELNELKLRSV